jgi:hypothetical protein
MFLAVFPAMLPLPTYAHLKGSIFRLRFLCRRRAGCVRITRVLYIIPNRRGKNQQTNREQSDGVAGKNDVRFYTF